MKIDGAPSIQLMESADKVGVHHYGFVTDDVEEISQEFKQKEFAKIAILRESL